MRQVSRCSLLVWSVALLTTLSGSLRSEQGIEDSRTPAKQPSHRLTIVGLPNFAEVTPMLYRGGQPTPDGFRQLAAMGVNVVVDLRLSGEAREQREVETLGMRFVKLPWHCLVPRDDVFRRFLEFVLSNPEKRVFVHCRYGDDRTGMTVAAYRMAVEGWTAEDARREMDQFGFHSMACASLVEYEKRFPERLKNEADFSRVRAASGPAKK